MKMMKQIVRAIRNSTIEKKRAKKNEMYYDNYTMLGSILGGYCGLLKFGGK